MINNKLKWEIKRGVHKAYGLAGFEYNIWNIQGNGAGLDMTNSVTHVWLSDESFNSIEDAKTFAQAAQDAISIEIDKEVQKRMSMREPQRQ